MASGCTRPLAIPRLCSVGLGQQLDHSLAGAVGGPLDRPATDVAVAGPVGFGVVVLGLAAGDREAGPVGGVHGLQYVVEGGRGDAGGNDAVLAAILDVEDHGAGREREV